jgi:hypothetical protein
MSDWTWEYVPDAPDVIGGLTPAQVEDVENLASRIAGAVAVRSIWEAETKRNRLQLIPTGFKRSL